MTTLDTAFARANRKSRKGNANYYSGRAQRPATAGGLARIFGIVLEECGYGAPPLLAQSEYVKLKSYIRLARSAKHEEEWIYGQVEGMVRNWEELKKITLETLQGKQVRPPVRPTIKFFNNCRDSIISALENIINKTENSETTADWAKQITQADLDKLGDQHE